MENEISRIKKVPLSSFIDILLSLYKRGVDYVDVVHLLNEEGSDSVGIQFTEEYMHKKYKEEGEQSVVVPVNRKITDEDLNDLL